jgi:fructose-1,6-bisphosphatase/inositol monophosphatase family enzyme
MDMIDPQRVAAIIEEVADQEVLPRFQALADHEIIEKRAGDLVTVADLETEKALTRRLADLLPGSRVVGEEAVEADRSVLDLFEEDSPVWIVDPVDGTSNFAHGNPTFAVMVGLSQGPDLLAGWIYDPCGGRMAIAEAGSGAYLQDGTRLRVAKGADPGQMRGPILAGLPNFPELGARIRERRNRVDAVRSLRCAGQEYLRLALGENHFALFTKTKPWDHVPGVVIHREAGGFGRLLDGEPYTPRDSAAPGILLAPDEASWLRLRETLVDP